MTSSALATTLAYHERTKHLPFQYAASLGYMDWATQPDPFRRFDGAPLLPLDFVPIAPDPAYGDAFDGRIPPAPLDRTWVSQLFQDALALSAWKQAGASRWALRVNPSSGNLHPTEGYLVAGPIAGLHGRPAVYHYAPHEHALECRVEISERAWSAVSAALPRDAVLVGLTSIHWREAWKYGERAFRYCHHDAGHAIAAFAIAAAGLGWQAHLLEAAVDEDLGVLLGVHQQEGIEAEHADSLMVIAPSMAGARTAVPAFTMPPALRDELQGAAWRGVPNRLSHAHHHWPIIDEVAAATTKRAPPDAAFWSTVASGSGTQNGAAHELPLRAIVHQRRSAVALDGRTGLSRDAFYDILLSVMPGGRPVPFTTLPWRPAVDLLLFVHRVEDVDPGLYLLLRDPARRAAFESATGRPLDTDTPPGCPVSLPLVLLQKGDARRVAEQTSCEQDIAADGAFAVAMIADYRSTLESYGPWFYRRLFWETGLIGQVLYLEAEAHGIRGTGIGCFFDDLTHLLLGLSDDRFQVLYHFTMGGAVDDARLQTHPPYAHLARLRLSDEAQGR